MALDSPPPVPEGPPLSIHSTVRDWETINALVQEIQDRPLQLREVTSLPWIGVRKRTYVLSGGPSGAYAKMSGVEESETDKCTSLAYF